MSKAILGTVLAAMIALTGCNERTSNSTTASACDEPGVLVTYEGEDYCVRTAEEGDDEDVICPDGFDHATIAEGFVICSPNEDAPSDDTIEDVADAARDTGVEPGDPPRKLDMLFVVDDSGSMCEEQSILRNNMEQLMQALLALNIDFQLAVITTDMIDPRESGRFQNIPDGTLSPNCTSTSIDISHCPNSESGDELPLILRSSDPRYATPSGEIDGKVIGRDFGCMTTVGTAGDGFEMGLEAARTALGDELQGGYNAGFVRDDAHLAIVFVSDENDCSDDGAIDKVNGNACEWNSQLLVDTSEYVDFFAGLKDGDRDRVFLSGIVAPDTGARYSPGAPVQPSCNSDNGEGYAGYRYLDVIKAFPNRAVADVCDSDYGNALDHLAEVFRQGFDWERD